MDPTSPTFLLTLLDGHAPSYDDDDERPERGALIAGRYEVLHELGSGGFGEVWVARDRVRSKKVAVKLVPSGGDAERQRARREVNALRWLRLPGVVQMHDEGRWRGAWFIVMELLDGQHFPGQGTGATWDELRHPTMRLFEILAGVHRAGVVHRDLKPGNVLLVDGDPVVLDFGLARGKALTSSEVRSAEGTPRYAAPEQLLRRETDGRCDLYAVGVMLFEALTGKNPHGAPVKVSQLVQARLLDPAPPVALFAPDLPSDVAALIDALLARNREDRPSSAVACLAALGGSGATLGSALLDRLPTEPVEERPLQELFAGPDAFLHLREDGARVLWERTGGAPGRVRDELEAWIRGGLAREVGDRVHLDRSSIERLQAGLRLCTVRYGQGLDQVAEELLAWIRLAWPDTGAFALRRIVGSHFDRVLDELVERGLVWRLDDGRLAAGAPVEEDAYWSPAARADAHVLLARVLPKGSEGRFRHLVAGRGDAREVLGEARTLIDDLLDAGHLARAAAIVELALVIAQERGERAAERQLLLRRADLALAEESREAVEELLYVIGRSELDERDLEQLEALARGVRAALGGEAARARELLQNCGELVDEALEVKRHGWRVFAASFSSMEAQEELLDELRPWAEREPLRLAKWQGWQGNLRHRQSRFVEAAELHMQAAEGKTRAGERLSSTLNAAICLQDGLVIERAGALAEEAAASAAELRHARYEVTAVWIQRTVRYRLGSPHPPDTSVVDAAALVAPVGAACLAANEAASAWRLGHPQLAWKLARRAEQAFRALGLRDGAALMTALALAAGEPVRDLDGLVEGIASPSIAVQVLGLLALVQPERSEHHHERARRLATTSADLVGAPNAVRMDVLSLAEALGDSPIPEVPGAVP